MADDPKPPEDEKPAETPDTKSGETPDTPGARGGMSEQQIREEGLAIDVPFETGAGSERMRYADLGEGKKFTPPEGWPPEQGQAPPDEEGAPPTGEKPQPQK